MQNRRRARSKRSTTEESAIESVDQNRSVGRRVKPVKSTVLVNSELNTVALINDPFRKSATNNETTKHLKADKKTEFKEEQQRVRRDRFSTQSNGQPTQKSYRPLQPGSRSVSKFKDTNEPSSPSKDLIIEIPERLLKGRQMSPRSREHNLNKVVKNIHNVFEDAKKRYNGKISTKVIVTVADNDAQTT
ncbi:unnamed protein product [Rotaria sp. Silwood2]|nr:unnamed protein product [Rotaria sp. Silwood2]CAF4630071.1 unnamed protein product [Rotaria sp. Silwood2]